MSEIAATRSLRSGRIPDVQDVRVAGKSYVLVAKADFERLRLLAEGPREDAATLARDSVGRDLRARRHQARLTLAQVAGRAGIRQETLSRIENGRTNPTVQTVRCVLMALDPARQS
jgi:DNA-binding XRE family transcriptional regulator